MFHMEQKLYKGTKDVPLSQNQVNKDPIGAKSYLLWHIKVLNCSVWLYMASFCHIWPCMILWGLVQGEQRICERS